MDDRSKFHIFAVLSFYTYYRYFAIKTLTYLLLRAPARFHNDVCKWRMVRMWVKSEDGFTVIVMHL